MDSFKAEMGIHIKTMQLQAEGIRAEIKSHEEDIDLSKRFVRLNKERLCCVESRIGHAIKELGDE